ncbi:MAG: hypothetical protein HY814_07950 [Candidatus Riflebacteria bacterium]|nr:hypothetical protein [Candidatus Riflebacteria bacterium]
MDLQMIGFFLCAGAICACQAWGAWRGCGLPFFETLESSGTADAMRNSLRFYERATGKPRLGSFIGWTIVAALFFGLGVAGLLKT